MARLESIQKFGYYPIPEHALHAAANLVKPADFKGARGFDLTAGEGTALLYLSQKLNFDPYANEYDLDRASACAKKFGALHAMQGDMFDLDVSHHSAHYGWINPPFQNSVSGNYGRTEQQFLKEQFMYFVDNAVVQFVCYTQHLANEEVTELIYSNLDNVLVHQVPGADLGAYKMVIVTGTVKEHSGMRKKDVLAQMDLVKKAEYHYGLFKAHQTNPQDTEVLEELNSVFPDITKVTEPIYTIPEVKFGKYFRFVFSQKNLSDELMCLLATQNLPSIAELNPLAIEPQEENKEQRVVIPPRVKQTQALIASGLLNGFVVETPEGLAVIRAVTRQIETQINTTAKAVEDDPDAETDSDGDDLDVKGDVEKANDPEKQDTIVTRFRTAPKTTISLLYQSGRMDNIADDDKLAEFIAANAEAIFVYIQEHFVPDYMFDFINGLLTNILSSIRVEKVNKNGSKQKSKLYAAQKHVAAAIFAKLRKDKAVILAGQMGTGKTIVAASVMHCMKYRDHGEHMDVFQSISKQNQMRPDQFNIVLSPPHLINKWLLEIKGAFPTAYVGVIASGTGVKPIIGAMEYIRGIDDQPADALKVLIISREMIKVGESWEPAVVTKMDYRAIQGALTVDKQFTSEMDWKHLMEGNVASPYTGMPIVKWKKGGKGVQLTLSKLENQRHHNSEEYTWSGVARRVKKNHPSPRQDARLEVAMKSAKREIERGAFEQAAYVIKAKLDEIRDGRLEFDNNHSPLNFLWQEKRDNAANPVNVARELAKRIGLKDFKATVSGHEIVHPAHVMPLPDIAQNYMKKSEYLAEYLKKPRAGLQGLAKFLASYFADRIYILVADEVHEYAAGDDSSQGLALLRLAGAAQKLIYMTGTLYKGVASSLYFIEFTTNEKMKRQYPWGEVMKFVAKMGVLERIVKVKNGIGTDGKISKKESKTERISEKPGCAPELLEQVIDHTVFLSLDEVGASIPVRHDRAVPVWMTDEMSEIYRKFDKIITQYLKDRISEGDNSFMGAAFHALNNWSNWPFEFYPVYHRRWLTDPDTGKRFLDVHLVCTIPPILDTMTNKDRVILDDIRDSLARGRGVAVYFHQTGIHADRPNKDILKRFENLLKLEVPEAKPVILRASVPTTKRETWLEDKVAKGMNVLLCNPNLVKTGLDLIWAKDIMWYELDYSLPTVDQASARAERIGQDSETSVSFYFNIMKPVKPKIVIEQDLGGGLSLRQTLLLDEPEVAVKNSDVDMMNQAIEDALGMALDFVPGDEPIEDDPFYDKDIPETREANEPIQDYNDPFLDGIVVSESLTPIGAFEFNTIEAEGVIIVDRKRQAARFLYGQGGGSLSSVEAESKTLVEELAEAVGKSKKIMTAASLFKRALEQEIAKDAEMGKDVDVEIIQEELPSGVKAGQLRKRHKPFMPKLKQYIPNWDKHNELLGIVPEVVATPAPVEAAPEPEVIPEMTFDEPLPIVAPAYKIVQLSMAMRETKWKADYAKFGVPVKRDAEKEGETNSYVFDAKDNKLVIWLKTFDGAVERRSVIQQKDNFTIVGIIRYS